MNTNITILYKILIFELLTSLGEGEPNKKWLLLFNEYSWILMNIFTITKLLTSITEYINIYEYYLGDFENRKWRVEKDEDDLKTMIINTRTMAPLSSTRTPVPPTLNIKTSASSSQTPPI